MRQPFRIRQRLDIELPLAPCAGALRAATVRPRPAPYRGGRIVRKAVAGAALVAVLGCATHEPNPPQQFRIEPVFSVMNSAQSATSSQAYYTLGKYFDSLHEWGRAVDAYRQAAAADTGNIEAFNALGVALAQGRRFAEAEATLRQAVVLAPERTHIRNNLGYVLLLEGRPQDAMSQLKVAVSQNRTSAIALANLRDAMARSGARPDAMALVEDVGKPNPATSALAIDAPANPASAPAGDTRIAGPIDTPSPIRQPLDTVLPAAVATATAVPTSTTSLATDQGAGASALLQSARLEVSNGNGMSGMATHVGLWLAARGVPTQRLTNQQPYAQRQTVIQYRSGHEDAARRLASVLPASAQTAAQASPGLRSDVRVVLGRDWAQIADCLARTSCQPATTAAAAAAVPMTVVAQR